MIALLYVLFYVVLGVAWGYWEHSRFLKHLYSHFPRLVPEPFGWRDAPVLLCTALVWPILVLVVAFTPCSLCKK